MDCTESLPLLTEFHDRHLDDTLGTQVRAHLAKCSPCANVFDELGEIVNVAVALNRDPALNFPDEDAFWQRLKIGERKIH